MDDENEYDTDVSSAELDMMQTSTESLNEAGGAGPSLPAAESSAKSGRSSLRALRPASTTAGRGRPKQWQPRVVTKRNVGIVYENGGAGVVGKSRSGITKKRPSTLRRRATVDGGSSSSRSVPVDSLFGTHVESSTNHQQSLAAVTDFKPPSPSMTLTPNVPDDLGRCPLHIAAAKGDLQMVNWLLQKQADVDCIDRNGSTPLHLAVTAGHLGVVVALLDAGADGHFIDGFRRTPLDLVLSRLRMLRSLHRRASSPSLLAGPHPSPQSTPTATTTAAAPLNDDLHQMIQILRHYAQTRRLPFKMTRPRSPSDIQQLIRHGSPVPLAIEEEPELEADEESMAGIVVSTGKQQNAQQQAAVNKTTANHKATSPKMLLNQLSAQLSAVALAPTADSNNDDSSRSADVMDQLEAITLQFQRRLMVHH